MLAVNPVESLNSFQAFIYQISCETAVRITSLPMYLSAVQNNFIYSNVKAVCSAKEAVSSYTPIDRKTGNNLNSGD